MGRTTKPLPANALDKIKAPGLHSDGGGLYLQIAPTGARSWIFRFMLNGRRRDMGLGKAGDRDMTLAKARARAAEARQVVADGKDPIALRDGARANEKAERAKSVTFKEAAERCIVSRKAGWRNEKHEAQWTATLEAYAYPVMGHLPVGAIEVGHVTKILEPIWSTKTETARRLRGRIEAVLDFAAANGWRTGDNPARWRGHLQVIMAPHRKVATVTNHPALPYTEIGAFVAELRTLTGTAPLALEFLILTATRTSEATGARWSEIDMAKAVWTIPALRIKAGKEHRIPLSPRALEILHEAAKTKTNEFVFPGAKRGKSLSNGAFLAVLERMSRSSITAHGFRSTFRDWAAERTNYPREIAEKALAHALKDKTEAAYQRGDLLAKRARMMVDWAKHCATAAKAGNVVAIRKA